MTAYDERSGYRERLLKAEARAEAAEELLRFIDAQDYGDLPDELKDRIRDLVAVKAFAGQEQAP